MGEKLKISIGKSQGQGFSFSTDGPDVITVCFNPTDFSESKSTTFAEKAIPGLHAPIIQFDKGAARTLSLKLLLDTSTYMREEAVDVRSEYIEKLEKLMKVDSELHAPPPCRVMWGSLNFTGVVESIDSEYILFLSDGKPVRARVTLKIKEIISVEKLVKEASMASPDRRKSHLVTEGDSLWLIAHRAYGDASLWRMIAQANHMDNPNELQMGREIIIPVLNPRGANP